ncbi:type VII secretion integral membrane protein EccD, partial [Mycobacterium sp. ITM-2017-0098]
MTATVAPPSSSSTAPGRPSTTRVTILTGRRMTDLVLPSAAPIETYVDETVSVLADILADTPADVLAGFDFKAQGVWSFARPGAPPIRLTESLDDAGVVDGSLLTVVSVSRTERYRPLVEDVIDAIAVLDETPEFDRRALYRFVGLFLPLVAFMITVVAVLSWLSTGRDWWWPVALGVLGVGLMGGSVLAQNRYGNLDMAESLLVSSVLTFVGGVTLAVPLPEGVESLGAPQIAGAGAL